MTYYSQYKQDVILDKHVFKGFRNGFFVDVGAHDGKSLNNTLYFEESLGWSGINIEPIKSVGGSSKSLDDNSDTSSIINSIERSEFNQPTGSRDAGHTIPHDNSAEWFELIKLASINYGSSKNIDDVTSASAQP